MGTRVGDSISNLGQLGSYIGTAWKWGSYGLRFWQVADRAKKLYANVKELRETPENDRSYGDYARIGAAAALTGVEVLSLYSDVRADRLITQSKASNKKVKEELSDLKAAGEAMNQAAAKVSTSAAKNPQLQRALEDYNSNLQSLPVTDDIADDIGGAFRFTLRLQQTLEKGVELQSSVESGSLMTAMQSMNDSILNCTQEVSRQIKLSDELYRTRNTQTMCAIAEFFAGLVKESSETDRFSHLSANMNLILSGLQAYRSCFPTSKLSLYIKQHNLLTGLADLYATTRQVTRAAGRLPAYIPENLHEDPELCKNVCPITTLPIRFPMAIVNQNGRRFYFEEASLLAHFAHREQFQLPLTNPSTGENIQLEDAIQDPVLKRVIEKRLEALRDRWDR